jgi:hypothetical protein
MKDIERLINDVPKTKFDLWFKEIATTLMSNHIIIAGERKFCILETEFYYYDEQHHQDKSTYGYYNPSSKIKDRVKEFKKAQRDTLTWFFHYSGIDIVIGKGINPGGILIRQIQEIKDNKLGEVYGGPLVVMLELMRQGVNVHNGTFHLKLEECMEVKSNFKNAKVEAGSRFGIGKNAEKYEQENYNFQWHHTRSPQ